MKLRTLKVHGFKSFADSTTVDFHDGITAVVGPNGCGKSNISDAIRWVLGEQRPTAIRGAKMEEAIFQGTVHRRPVNRGSVSLVVSNEDRSLPLPFEEVEVGRQVFRDGGSEYSINRSACRLRDVVDLCRDTGLGANAYSIIENRMIDAILSDRAEERRGLFEEAAGIGKYKDRRKAATRRLERAEMDLQRLEDVIGEVQTKVRSLARQKGKAQRYTEFRQRRLDVEVAVVRHRLDELRVTLTGIEQELATGVGQSDGTASELAAAEAAYESLRLGQIEAEGSRTEAAQALEQVRTELARWERDLAVADEKAAYAERRLAQIEAERSEAKQQAEALAEDERTLSAERDTVGSELDAVRGAAAERAEVVAAVRARLEEARGQLDTVEGRARELARRGAQLQGDAEASDAQAEELETRMARVRGELDSASKEIADLDSQGDLFSGRVSDLADGVASARGAADAAAAAARESRAALEAARAAEGEATRTLVQISARKAALEALERDGGGVQPVVKAAIDEGLAGVRGVLTDFIGGDAAAVAAAEAYLGPLANALIVEDGDAVDRVLDWFSRSWDGGGGLVVLALDRAPAATTGGDLLDRLELAGDAAPWLRALLGAVEIGDSGSDATTVTITGGVVRVGNPGGGSGVLQRREELKALTGREAEARQELERATLALKAAEEAATDAQAAHEAARRALQEAEDEHRRVDAEMSAQTDRRTRADRVRDELARQLEGAKAARTRATERAAEARADRETVLEQEAGLQNEREEARAAVDAVQEEWETARAAEARVAVDVARLEGDFRRLTDRFDGVQASRKRATDRMAALDAEEAALVEERGAAKAVREEGDQATERLFEARTASEALLRERDSAMQQIADAVRQAERRARDARSAERAATDRRHELELKKQECASSIDRIRDRLEGEWGRPLDALLEEANPVEGEPAALQQELDELIAAIERLGPVNMLAVEEHAEESERLDFLTSQRADLVEARNDLRSAIREINKTATELFAGTFEQIRENFRETFLRLFEGGEADIWLQDSEDPLESPIEIHASPRGKKTQRIDLLSGGERALTALSLLFGIYLVKPSPFCVLDEVDAPLDENNIGRFIRLLQDFKEQTQFVVITHNPRTIEAADWIYGVTMEEPGVSTIVGVRLEEALHAAGAA